MRRRRELHVRRRRLRGAVRGRRAGRLGLRVGHDGAHVGARRGARRGREGAVGDARRAGGGVLGGVALEAGLALHHVVRCGRAGGLDLRPADRHTERAARAVAQRVRVLGDTVARLAAGRRLVLLRQRLPVGALARGALVVVCARRAVVLDAVLVVRGAALLALDVDLERATVDDVALPGGAGGPRLAARAAVVRRILERVRPTRRARAYGGLAVGGDHLPLAARRLRDAAGGASGRVLVVAARRAGGGVFGGVAAEAWLAFRHAVRSGRPGRLSPRVGHGGTHGRAGRGAGTRREVRVGCACGASGGVLSGVAVEAWLALGDAVGRGGAWCLGLRVGHDGAHERAGCSAGVGREVDIGCTSGTTGAVVPPNGCRRLHGSRLTCLASMFLHIRPRW